MRSAFLRPMQLKSVIMDESAVLRSMTRITHEIIEKNSGVRDLVLLGIHRRGMPLAAMLRENIIRFDGKELPIGSIDISLYRDDLTELNDLPETGRSEKIMIRTIITDSIRFKSLPPLSYMCSLGNSA